MRRNAKHWSQIRRWRDPPMSSIATVVASMYGMKRAKNDGPRLAIGDWSVASMRAAFWNALGGTAWATSVGLLAYCLASIRR